MTAERTIGIKTVDHVGIRVADVERALTFYGVLGFKVHERVTFDEVVIAKNDDGIEINLIVNANNANDDKNILMDVPDKFAGFTHVALRVDSMKRTIDILGENGISITQGPVTFGRDGHVSVFVRDPDRNLIELRGREEEPGVLEGVTHYNPEN